MVRADAPRAARRFHLILPDSTSALENAVFITAADFARAEVERHEDDTLSDVIAMLKSTGAASLHRATAAHVERHIAVQLGDSLSLVAVIASATDNILALAMGLGHSEADALRARVERARVCEQPK
jgi:preprotein translocase subunit SecD